MSNLICLIKGHDLRKPFLTLYTDYKIWHRICKRCKRDIHTPNESKELNK